MENKILDLLQPQSSRTLTENLVSPDDNIGKKDESFFKILKFTIIKFLQIYGLRIVYSLVQSLLALKKKGLKGLTMELFIRSTFNIPNLRTAGFVSCLTGLFRLLNYLFKMIGKETYITCIISGLISSLTSIFIEEKTELMNFIILSVMIRSLYAIIIVLADKYKWPDYPRTANLLIFILASIGFIFIAFCHPTFATINKLFINFANFEGTEKDEINHSMQMVRII